MTRTNVARLGAVLAVLCAYGSILLAQQAPSKYEIGGEFTYLRLHPRPLIDNRLGFGARFTYNFNDLFALDTEWSITPADKPLPLPKTDFTGGPTNEFFAGLKVGGRKKNFGLFAKLRPGLITNGSVVKVLDFSTITGPFMPPAIITGRRTDPLLDAGAVIEFYPAKRWILRYDVSDTIIFYGDGVRAIGLSPPITTGPPNPGFAVNTFHFTAGISYRFGK
jgi:hypothetical protein